jgi:hypothetical protein
MRYHTARCAVTLFVLIGLVVLQTHRIICAESLQNYDRVEIKAVLGNKNANNYIEVTGLSESVLRKLRTINEATSMLASFFVVATEEAASSPDIVPMLGSYSIEDHSIRFRPRFPLMAGQKYVAWFDLPGFLQMRGTEICCEVRSAGLFTNAW